MDEGRTIFTLFLPIKSILYIENTFSILKESISFMSLINHVYRLITHLEYTVIKALTQCSITVSLLKESDCEKRHRDLAKFMVNFLNAVLYALLI